MRIFSPIISGSAFMSSGSILFGTSSWAISSSYAITASYAMNAAPIQPFPYNGTVTPAVVSGSLLVSGSGITSTGSINITAGTFNVDGVNVLDTALAYAIALG